MIVLSADIHHSSLGTGNQAHSNLSEPETALIFSELLREYGVKATYFVSGKTFLEDPKIMAKITQNPLLEIGGHNWDCFEPQLWHRIWNKAVGSYNGPAWYQKRDAEKTLAIIEAHTGRKPSSWRNHMYKHGPYTEKVLKELGIQICSDGVRKNSNGPELHPTGLYNFALNIIPDHEHLYHAERTPEWVEQWVKRYRWSDDFGSESYSIDVWTELVLEQLRSNEARGIISNLILHPITMYLCDQFASAKRILAYISTRPQMTMTEIASAQLQRERIAA
ncbi:MAG: polysaccharide deacetylase family protein [Candidatus Sericytochromatia bacterium]